MGALKANDQRLTKANKDEDLSYSSIRSGKVFSASANLEEDDFSD